MKWDKRFIKLAAHIADWSKDPSTKCGSVITEGKRIVSLGFNGFPQGVSDHDDRLNNRGVKYKMVLHAEVNSILFANKDLSGCTIYVAPMPPCSRCAAQIIQAGIKRIVTVKPSEDALSRWKEDFDIAGEMYKEAGVEFHFVDKEPDNSTFLTGPAFTPNASLPPIGDGPRKKIMVEVEVPADWIDRLDMQWVLEREIHADRWNWQWPQYRTSAAGTRV